ncbi:hypothetical protein BDN70DRAFT_992593 [Pholiota conissans]|uniref:Uncharacterized protein n=1 Tax=Pholiota conissans TaxID=109636 RepID=A0A9P5Z353_9AGAR|nr:hypothetical protein BDN70DRAFT_992593 [Pholiota conissans]
MAQPKPHPSSLGRLQIPGQPPAPPVSAPTTDQSTRKTTEPEESEGQPSKAIRKGTESLIALFECEQAKLRAAHAAELRALSGSGNSKTTSHRTSWDADRQQLAALRDEHARLLSCVQAVGLEYVPRTGELLFSPPVARIVDDFVQGARMQEEQMQSAPEMDFELDEGLFGNVGPAEFFGVLGRVLQKGRAFGEAIDRQQQQQQQQQQMGTPEARTSPSEFGKTNGTKRPSPFNGLDSPSAKHPRA